MLNYLKKVFGYIENKTQEQKILDLLKNNSNKWV
jgi:hypothetical protein